MTFDFASPLLNAIIGSFSALEEPLARHLEAIDEWKARQNDKPALWKDKSKFAEIEDARDVSTSSDARADDLALSLTLAFGLPDDHVL